MKVVRSGAALLLALLLVASGCSSDDDRGKPAAGTATTIPARRPTVEPATLEGPITVGTFSPAADPRPVDLRTIGYVEQEFFASGKARWYKVSGRPSRSGRWDTQPGTPTEYKTRFYVRRPASAERFNGTVVVEWLNVTTFEAAPDWAYTNRAIVDEGAAWVGVSVEAQGVIGGALLTQNRTPEQYELSTGLRGADPERYGSLVHPGDAFAFDMFAQIGAALRSPGDVDVLGGGGKARRIIATGKSQAATFLTSYLNAAEPRTNAYDGFFVHSRGAGVARLDGLRGGRGADTPFRIRDDLGVPVVVFETETDIELLQYGLARQPDSELLRVWEVAGAAHADAFLVGGLFESCPARTNDGPQHYVANAAMAGLLAWVEDGEALPPGTPLETRDDGTTIARDERGLAKGGIRTPSVDVPVAALSGRGGVAANRLCSLLGSTQPFDAATLSSLYPSRADYLRKFDAALDRSIESGFVRDADRDMYAAEARAVPFG